MADMDGIHSLLDTDLYKFTMLNFIRQYYPDTKVSYAFINRAPTQKFNEESFEYVKHHVGKLRDLIITEDEIEFLQAKIPQFENAYLDYLRNLRLNPDEQVKIEMQSSGDLSISIEGIWSETIFYETMIMSIVSEAYFKFVDKDWDYDGQEEQAYEKGCALLKDGIGFSEFGSRRRRSYHTQEIVLKALIRASTDVSSGSFVGTSNVHFAHKYDLTPIGTIAHELVMGVAAISNDYIGANSFVLENWMKLYQKNPSMTTCLPDTFSSNLFFATVKKEVISKWSAVRQDSGDVEEFVKKLVAYYKSLEIDTLTKTVILSDSLNIEKAIRYHKFCKDLHINVRYGIGTFFTNDFKSKSTDEKSKALNIVIKLHSANGRPAIKISDEWSKNSGDKFEVERISGQKLKLR